jgi:CheY-like chemotaxis protein
MAALQKNVRGWFTRESAPHAPPRPILIVDPDATQRQSAARAATGLGYVTTEATTSAEAVQVVEDQDPVCVLLAFDLGGGEDGMAALATLRDVAPELPIIMLARTYREPRTSEALRRGALAYLARPWGPDDLREILPRR